MYDTIRAYYKGDLAELEKLPNINFVEDIKATGEFVGYKAICRNMMIYLSLSHRLTIEGSLSRFVFGDNSHTIDRQTTKNAIIELCNILGIPPKEFKVTRLDVSTIIPTTGNMKIETLKNVLGDIPRAKNWNVKNSLYWGNSQKEICIYDKTRWAKETKTDLPEILKGGEWVRVELRMLKNIDGQTKQPKDKHVTLDKLYNSSFYGRVCDMWEKSFLSITRQSGCLTDRKTWSKAKEGLEMYFAFLESKVSEGEKKAYIEFLLSRNPSKQERTRWRKLLKSVLEKYTEADDTTKKIYNEFQQLIKSNKAVY